MPTVASSDQTPIHYRVIGDGPRNVLLVHGWMMSGAVFDDLVEKLDTTGLRLVIPDLRGSGQSGKPSGGYTLEQHVRDVLAVADHAGPGHYPGVERPAETAALLTSFLAGLGR